MAIRPVVCADGTIRPLEAGERIDPKALGLFKAIRAKSDQVRVVANPDGSVTIDRVCCEAPTPPPPPERKTDVAIEKSITTDVHNGTGSVFVTTTVRNVSGVRAENVKVRETFTGMDFDSEATVSRGSYDVNGHVWTIGVLDPQQVETARLTFFVSNATSVASVGVVSTTTPETTTANNEARVERSFAQSPCKEFVALDFPCLPPAITPDSDLGVSIRLSAPHECCGDLSNAPRRINVKVTAFIVNYQGNLSNPAVYNGVLAVYPKSDTGGCGGHLSFGLYTDLLAHVADYDQLLDYVRGGNVRLHVVLTDEDGSEFADFGYGHPVLEMCA